MKYKGLKGKVYSTTMFILSLDVIEEKNAFETFGIKDWNRAQSRQEGLKLLNFLFLKCDQVSLKGTGNKFFSES